MCVRLDDTLKSSDSWYIYRNQLRNLNCSQVFLYCYESHFMKNAQNAPSKKDLVSQFIFNKLVLKNCQNMPKEIIKKYLLLINQTPVMFLLHYKFGF